MNGMDKWIAIQLSVQKRRDFLLLRALAAKKEINGKKEKKCSPATAEKAKKMRSPKKAGEFFF